MLMRVRVSPEALETMTDTEIRFWDKVEIADKDTCWLWLGALNNRGYGLFSVNSKLMLAHRYSYQLHKDPIGNLCVLHTCDNPKCVNPNHLFLGTQGDNNRDCVRKGRHKGPSNLKILTPESAKEIQELYITGLYTQNELAKEYNVHPTTISNVINRKGGY